MAVVGGDPTAVATAIWKKKAPGCAYNGNTTVNVQDTDGYQTPYPTYAVKFQIPSGLPILFAVNIVNSAQVPSDAVAQVKAAILAAFAGLDGGARAQIGATLYASRYFAPVAALGSWAQVVEIKLGVSGAAVRRTTLARFSPRRLPGRRSPSPRWHRGQSR